ncbi:hypothetical protein [Carp edema virus]|nr:hypothetical protein [Carp edema virus]
MVPIITTKKLIILLLLYLGFKRATSKLIRLYEEDDITGDVYKFDFTNQRPNESYCFLMSGYKNKILPTTNININNNTFIVPQLFYFVMYVDKEYIDINFNFTNNYALVTNFRVGECYISIVGNYNKNINKDWENVAYVKFYMLNNYINSSESHVVLSKNRFTYVIINNNTIINHNKQWYAIDVVVATNSKINTLVISNNNFKETNLKINNNTIRILILYNNVFNNSNIVCENNVIENLYVRYNSIPFECNNTIIHNVYTFNDARYFTSLSYRDWYNIKTTTIKPKTTSRYYTSFTPIQNSSNTSSNTSTTNPTDIPRISTTSTITTKIPITTFTSTSKSIHTSITTSIFTTPINQTEIPLEFLIFIVILMIGLNIIMSIVVYKLHMREKKELDPMRFSLLLKNEKE